MSENYSPSRREVTPGSEILEFYIEIGYGLFLMTFDQLAEEALSLPTEARALLSDKIVESLDSAGLTELDQLWIAQARRRRDEVRSGRVQTISGEEAQARIRRATGGE